MQKKLAFVTFGYFVATFGSTPRVAFFVTLNFFGVSGFVGPFTSHEVWGVLGVIQGSSDAKKDMHEPCGVEVPWDWEREFFPGQKPKSLQEVSTKSPGPGVSKSQKQVSKKAQQLK